MGIINELYETTEQYITLDELLTAYYWQAQNMDEIPEGEYVELRKVEEKEKELEGDIENKAENIAKLIKYHLETAAVIQAEEDRLEKRKKTHMCSAEWLKNTLYANLKAARKEKFKTPLFSFTIVKNGGKQPLYITDNLDEIPGKYLIPQPPKPNKDAIRELLKEKEVDWAHLEPRGESLRIR